VADADAKDDGQMRCPPIVYFGNDWSAENRTSSHHVARWLARRTTVVYFETPGLRAPKASSRDVRKVVRKVLGFLRGPRRQPEGLWLGTLLQIPLHRSALVRRINLTLLRATVRGVMWRLAIRRPIVWFVVPHVGALAGQLGERLSVYYCIDDYAALPDVDERAVREMDEALTTKADLVFAASPEVLARKRFLNQDSHLSPHGVDFAHFVQAQDPELTEPDDVRSLPRPIVGFFGLIEQWIDLDLVGWLAAMRPRWTFFMIGRVAVDESALPREPNVRFVGSRPYDSLPAYGKAFDVAILPYRLTPQVLAANPLKLREYLAMGKPVVSVSTPVIDGFGELVAIARSREDFLTALDRAVSGGLSPQQRRVQTQAVSGMTWDANLSKVLKVVEERLAKTPS
jgi:glycosyltransferase involved in cell wall biosynthesis